MKFHTIAMLALLASLCIAPQLMADDAAAGDKFKELPRAEVVEVDSISQYGITWTFDKPVRAGRFVTGDWWVIGPVKIIKIDPPTADGLNGSMVNPQYSNRQGYDRRIVNGKYIENLNVAIGISGEKPLTVQPNSSLISSRSRSDTKGRPYVQGMSMLTVLEEVPPQGAFRPFYIGDGKRAIPATADQLKRDRLKKLPPIDSAPDIDKVLEGVKRPWIDHVNNNYQAQYQLPADNMPNYGQPIAELTSTATLLLNLDLPQEKKEPLMIAMVQIGLDLQAITSANKGRFSGGGGHNSGRKLPIVLAGHLLDNKEMLSTDAQFAEDTQTYFGKGWTGATALWSSNHVDRSMEDHEHLHPSQWTVDGRGKPGDPKKNSNSHHRSESYRRANSSHTFVGSALAARIMGLEEAWNHPALFAYVERWMTEDDKENVKIITEAVGRNDLGRPHYRQGRTGSRFISEMFKEYWEKTKPADNADGNDGDADSTGDEKNAQ